MIMDYIKGTFVWHSSKIEINTRCCFLIERDEYMKLNNIDKVEMIMGDSIVCTIYYMTVLLKNVSEKHKKVQKFTKCRLLLYPRI